jgi:DNA-binding NarL/FixJ family response regulator
MLIVSASPFVRLGLRALLKEMGVTSVVYDPHTTQEAESYIAPDLDLVIMNPEMPDMNPILFVQQVRRQAEQAPILFFGGRSATLHSSLAMKLNVNGYLGDLTDEKTIVATIRTVLGGMQCFPRREMADALSSKMQALSRKELTVLLLLRQGLRNKDIAQRLFLSEKTISAHKQKVLQKLGVSAIAQVDENQPSTALFNEAPQLF